METAEWPDVVDEKTARQVGRLAQLLVPGHLDLLPVAVLSCLAVPHKSEGLSAQAPIGHRERRYLKALSASFRYSLVIIAVCSHWSTNALMAKSRCIQ